MPGSIESASPRLYSFKAQRVCFLERFDPDLTLFCPDKDLARPSMAALLGLGEGRASSFVSVRSDISLDPADNAFS